MFICGFMHYIAHVRNFWMNFFDALTCAIQSTNVYLFSLGLQLVCVDVTLNNHRQKYVQTLQALMALLFWLAVDERCLVYLFV